MIVGITGGAGSGKTSVAGFFQDAGWEVQGCIPSPLLGPKGNREFLVYMTREQVEEGDG